MKIYKHFNARIVKTAFAVLTCFYPLLSYSQMPDLGSVQGNFQLDGQYYFEDSVIGAPDFPEGLGSNSFLNLIYTKGKFRAGVRYEAYLPTMQGFLRNDGSGIPFRYAEYTTEKFDIRVGNFYDQIGSGMILRAYEEWGLGYDSSLDGVKAAFRPFKGVEVKGFLGKQRNSFSNKVENLSAGIVRGGDIDVNLNQLIDSLADSKTRITMGVGFVSRFQRDDDPIQIYPENVAAISGRVGLIHGKWSLNAEYAHKINDPSTVNQIIYKEGNGLLVQAAYAQRGLGISLTAKRIDNLDFRSDRNAVGNDLLLNFLPPQTKQHTYRLATLFPWATQTTGEIGFQAEVFYKIARDKPLGGPYGTTISANFSRVHGLSTTPSEIPDLGYESSLTELGDLFFQDINIEISRKFSKKWKGTLNVLHFNYEKALFKNLTGLESTTDVQSTVGIADVTYKLKKKHTLRGELQGAFTKQEFGNWAMLLLEYSISPGWFFSIFDEYNYGNEDPDLRLHYVTGMVAYTWRSYRFQVGYGRQRFGVLCVGGVCRIVPASNGFSLSVTGSF